MSKLIKKENLVSLFDKTRKNTDYNYLVEVKGKEFKFFVKEKDALYYFKSMTYKYSKNFLKRVLYKVFF